MGKGKDRHCSREELTGSLTIDGSGVDSVHLAKLGQPVRLRFNNTEIELQKLAGEIEISPRSIEILDAAGPLMLQSRGSRGRQIRLERIDCALVVDAQRGDLLWLAGAKPAAAEIKLERGDIELRLAPEAVFSIEASTGRGKASHEFGPALQIEDRRRSATLRGGQGPLLKLETGRGDVKIERMENATSRAVEI
jgi:hypothetical protein